MSDFLEMIKPYVIEDMRKSGILASLTAVQAKIESGSGTSGLTKKANNFFGIKGIYNGQFVEMMTSEWRNGRYERVLAKFKKYPTFAESLADHSGMFNRLERYKNLRDCRQWQRAVKNVKADGYATEPNYVDILKKCIQMYKLYKWDAAALGLDPSEICPYMEPLDQSVRFWTTGEAARWLQWMLNHVAGHPEVEVDGIAEKITISALMEYQKTQKVKFDGIAGPITKGLLSDQYEKKLHL